MAAAKKPDASEPDSAPSEPASVDRELAAAITANVGREVAADNAAVIANYYVALKDQIGDDLLDVDHVCQLTHQYQHFLLAGAVDEQ